MDDPKWNGGLKTVYKAVVPAGLRYLIYKWRHPEHRFGEKLSRLARGGIEQFMDCLAAEGLLRGTILEIGAGAREANKRRFGGGVRNYWRSDITQWPGSKLDLFCDCTQMPFETASLDAVLCSEVLEHIRNFSQAISELSRVIRPGGYLVLTMPFFFPLHGVDKKAYGDFWRVTPGNLKIIFGGAFYLLREQTVHLFSQDDAFPVGVQQLWRRKNPNR